MSQGVVGVIGQRARRFTPLLLSGFALVASAFGAAACTPHEATPSAASRRPPQTVDAVDVETQAVPQSAGARQAGLDDARLPPSKARASSSRPRAPRAASSESPRVGAVPSGETDPIPTAASAPIESATAARGLSDSAPEQAPSVLSPSPGGSPIIGEQPTASGHLPAGQGLALTGAARGAGTAPQLGTWPPLPTWPPPGTGDARSGRRDLSRKPGLGGTHWDCPFPKEAAARGLGETVVQAQADVAADGTTTAVTIHDDPGFGFGAAARKCLLAQRLKPALDRNGARVAGTTALFRVVFQRDIAP